MGQIGSRIVGIIGELLLTAGVIVLLFVGWQLIVDDHQAAATQQSMARSISQDWHGRESAAVKAIGPKGNVPVMKMPGENTVFGVLRIPRLGSQWMRLLAVGTNTNVLDRIGAGLYASNPMPGAEGNVAVASHRGGNGSSFRYLVNLHIGDPIYIETQDGWYTYRFRNMEYVMENRVDVLNADPTVYGSLTGPKARILTLTTCNPYPFSTGERIAAYATFESFMPRGGIPPAGFAS